MPARTSKPRTKKPTRRGAKPHSLTRLGLAPALTASEIRELKARAAADLRTISNYVSFLVVEELKRQEPRPPSAGASLDDRRRPYSIALYLTAAERKVLGGCSDGRAKEGLELCREGDCR